MSERDLTVAEREKLRSDLAVLREQFRERREMLEAYARLTGPDSILNRPRVTSRRDYSRWL